MNRRPLRILAIGASSSPHVVNRVRCFAERGHEMFLLSETANGLTDVTELVPSAPLGQDAWVSKLAHYVGDLFGKNLNGAADMVRLVLDFRRLVRRANPDIVHVHYAYSAWGWVAAVLGLKPLIVSVMGGDVLFEEQGSPTRRGITLTKQLFRSANLITAKSNYLIGALNSLGGFGNKAIRVLWGVDPEAFKPVDSTALRAEIGIPSEAKVILSPKILQPFYNIEVLVEAMAKVVSHDARAHLVITEHGADRTYRAMLGERVVALGLQNNVSFVGNVTHARMPFFYGLAEVSVGIPKSDGLPQTLLEAMACGVPNIVGRLDRYGEIVQDGESAIFADITPDGIADGILKLLADESLRRHIGCAGREVVLQHANLPRDVDRVEAAYYRLARQTYAAQLPRPDMLANMALYWLGR